jgi:tripartite-type tricarboxylate transporter receptor subunit TctC
MKTTKSAASRRQFLKVAAASAATASMAWPQFAYSAQFPERAMQVFIPTRAGGGADRNFRSFSGVWKNHLKADFEPGFYPGAAGRVGYETYMGKASDDCHDLIFGNMGPEVLNWVVKAPSFNLEDYFYFLQVDADPGSIFVKADSPLQSVDDVIAAGKTRTLTVATSRLAHPASLAMLVLARKTGMKINLVPMSGGKNTRNGVATGELELGVLPVTSVMTKKSLKVLGLFDEKNAVPERTPGAVLVNTEYQLGIPPLAAGARAFGIKKAAADKYPDRFEKLVSTGMQVFEDPAYKEAVIKRKAPWALIAPGGREACDEYVRNITAVGKEYRDLLKG